MPSLPPEYLIQLVLFLAYNAGALGVVGYLVRENRELKESNRESTRLLRDIVWTQERVIRSDQPLDRRPSLTDFVNDDASTGDSLADATLAQSDIRTLILEMEETLCP